MMERVFGDLIEDTGAVIPSTAASLFTFVTDGIESAFARARAIAGEKRIGLMGANIPQQLLAAGSLTR